MRVQKGFKYRIYPTAEQKQRLAIQFGHARFVYNYFLTARRDHYQQTGKGLSYPQTAALLVELKRHPAYTWLNEAYSQVLQQKLMDLDRAYQNYFKGLADYPHYKCKHAQQSIRYPQHFDIRGSRIYLPKVGPIRAVFHRPIEGEMRSVTVSKTKSGEYYISILCQVEIEPPQHSGPTVGVDLGLKDFATLSTGEKIAHPKHLRQAERRLKRLQRALSRKKKGSRNREKARLCLARQHEKIARQRADFLHKLSRRLVNQFGPIKIEQLHVAGLVKNHCLAKSISDSGWGLFGQFLTYKGPWYGSLVERVDHFYPSSKECSVCHQLNHSLTLADRFWQCQGCSTWHDRDLNAAVNLEHYSVGQERARTQAGGEHQVLVEAGSP